MNSTSDSLALQHQKICKILFLIDNLLSEEEIAWWQLHRHAAQLSSECHAHIVLMETLQNELSATHWIVASVLNTIHEKTVQAGEKANQLKHRIVQILGCGKLDIDTVWQKELCVLSMKIQADLQLEKIIVYRMLDILKNSPVPTDADHAAGASLRLVQKPV